MKTLLAVATLILLSALAARADTLIDYTESVTNAPGGIGDFSWTVQHDGFIQPPPLPMFDARGNCTDCTANLFTPIESSPPSNGTCQITGVWLYPDFGPAPVTLFSPLCDGLYSEFSGGVLPDVGTLGTFAWQWVNPDGSENDITLSITDPPAVPEPCTWSLLLLGLLWVVGKIRL